MKWQGVVTGLSLVVSAWILTLVSMYVIGSVWVIRTTNRPGGQNVGIALIQLIVTGMFAPSVAEKCFLGLSPLTE